MIKILNEIQRVSEGKLSTLFCEKAANWKDKVTYVPFTFDDFPLSFRC